MEICAAGIALHYYTAMGQKGCTFTLFCWSFTACGLSQEGVMILNKATWIFIWRFCNLTFSLWRNKYFSPKRECGWQAQSIHYRLQQPEIVGNNFSMRKSINIKKCTGRDTDDFLLWLELKQEQREQMVRKMTFLKNITETLKYYFFEIYFEYSF